MDLVDYRPWDHKELDTTEQLTLLWSLMSLHLFFLYQADIPFAKIILKYTFMGKKKNPRSDLNKGKKIENCVDTMEIAMYI